MSDITYEELTLEKKTAAPLQLSSDITYEELTLSTPSTASTAKPSSSDITYEELTLNFFQISLVFAIFECRTLPMRN